MRIVWKLSTPALALVPGLAMLVPAPAFGQRNNQGRLIVALDTVQIVPASDDQQLRVTVGNPSSAAPTDTSEDLPIVIPDGRRSDSVVSLARLPSGRLSGRAFDSVLTAVSDGGRRRWYAFGYAYDQCLAPAESPVDELRDASSDGAQELATSAAVDSTPCLNPSRQPASPESSRSSHARAIAHPRLTVIVETPSTSAVSSIESPPK